MDVHVNLSQAQVVPLPDALTEAPHPDAGFVSLHHATKGFVSVRQGDVPIALGWSPTATSWERWTRVGQAYVHTCDDGTIVVLPASAR